MPPGSGHLTETAVAPGISEAAPQSGRARKLLLLAGNIGLALGTYYGLLVLGHTSYSALLCSTIVSGLRAVAIAVAQRRVDGLARAGGLLTMPRAGPGSV
ncbi:hypothetical protein [Nocardia transvalensis]|uniref:hypothetical protein n=1 Tax=Nocardia transvalensis TaxID=37333 RepID=UPI0018942AFC|nr:hypothetical protein [Nocardia transvalensis]MBF6333135.1 hypothetical protein [Nocardia transvalensis]